MKKNGLLTLMALSLATLASCVSQTQDDVKQNANNKVKLLSNSRVSDAPYVKASNNGLTIKLKTKSDIALESDNVLLLNNISDNNVEFSLTNIDYYGGSFSLDNDIYMYKTSDLTSLNNMDSYIDVSISKADEDNRQSNQNLKIKKLTIK